MTAVEASSADVELRARATGFVRRVRALGGRRVIEVDARGERNAGAWSVPTASRSLPALGPPENSGSAADPDRLKRR